MPANPHLIRALVIGTGHIGQQHLLALRQVPNCHVAVCDRSRSMAEMTADRFSATTYYTDAAEALSAFCPDVSHICTPASSHFPLAKLCLGAGSHTIVEKPITESFFDWVQLRQCAEASGQWLIEDHNYLYNPPVQKVRNLVSQGVFGQVVHLDIQFALNIHGSGSAFADPHLPHPAMKNPVGAISDFLTHLSYLTTGFVGRASAVRTVWQKRESSSPLPYDEMRALVVCLNGTASLSFSSHSQPDVFRLVVHGTRMTAHLNLFENICHIDRTRSGPGAVTALFNSLNAAKELAAGGLQSLAAKLSSSPGGYAGLHAFLPTVYQSLRCGQPVPVTLDDIENANHLVHELIRMENQI